MRGRQACKARSLASLHYRRERGGLKSRVESRSWDGEKWMERKTYGQDLVTQCSGVSSWVEGGAVP